MARVFDRIPGIKARIASSVDEALAFIQTEKDKV